MVYNSVQWIAMMDNDQVATICSVSDLILFWSTPVTEL